VAVQTRVAPAAPAHPVGEPRGDRRSSATHQRHAQRSRRPPRRARRRERHLRRRRLAGHAHEQHGRSGERGGVDRCSPRCSQRGAAPGSETRFQPVGTRSPPCGTSSDSARSPPTKRTSGAVSPKRVRDRQRRHDVSRRAAGPRSGSAVPSRATAAARRSPRLSTAATPRAAGRAIPISSPNRDEHHQ